MPIEIHKKDNENPSSLISRFLKKIQQSGVLREARKRRFYARTINRNKRRLSAIHREIKKAEMKQQKKLGLFPDNKKFRN